MTHVTIPEATPNGTSFLRAGGALGQLMESADWSVSALGPPVAWPASLKTAVAAMLATRGPAAILWSQEGLLLYNDATRDLLGEDHPEVLGQPVQRARPGLWTAIDPAVRRLLLSEDHGATPTAATEAVWQDCHCSPIYDGDGAVHGILAISRHHATVRQNAVLRGIKEIFEQAIRAETEEELGNTCLAVALALTASTIGFVGLVESDGMLQDVAISGMAWEQCRMYDSVGHRRPPRDFVLHGLYGRVVDEGETLLTNQPAQHPDSIGLPEGHPPLTAFLGVPLVEGGQTVGLLAVGNRPGGYGPEDQENLEALAPAVAEALARKRAEGALRASDERFRFVASNVPDILYFQDLDLRYVWVYNPVEPSAGSDIIGKTDADLLPPREAARISRIKQQVLETGERTRIELPLSPGGRTRWYEAVYAPSRDAAGQIVGLVSYSREITDRKLTEIALRKSQRNLARAQEIGRIGSWELDVNRNLLSWSDENYLIFGVPKGTRLTYETFLNAVHPDDRAYVDIQWHLALTGEPYDIEHRIVVNEETRWVREKAYVEMDEAGHVLSGYGITQDVTERRRAEDALRLERDKLQAVIDNASVGIGITEADGTVLSLNPEALRIHGFAAETDMRSALDNYAEKFDLRYPDGRPMPLGDWPASRALRGEEVRDYDVLLSKRGAEESRYISYTVAPIRDHRGEIALLVYNMMDLTDRKRTEEDLERQRQLLQTIYDSIPVMLAIYDPELEEITLNRHLERVTGWAAEDIAETSMMELIYPGPKPHETAATDAQSLAPRFRDFLMTTKDGGVVETGWASVGLGDGRQVGIGLDISESKRTEAALRRYAERLRILHEVDEAILAETSADKLALAAVQSIQRVLACAHASVVTYDPDAQQLVVLATYSALDHSRPNSGWRLPASEAWQPILAQLCSGESYVVADLQATAPFSPLIDHLQEAGVRAEIWEPILIGGSFGGMLGVGLDSPGTPPPESQEIVRELAMQLAIGLAHARLYDEVQRYASELEQLVHRRTAALEASEARFRTIFEEAAIGIALTETDGRVLAANPALRAMLGCTEGELDGKSLFSLMELDGDWPEETWLRALPDAAGTDAEEGNAGELEAAGEYAVEAVYRRKDNSAGEANVIISRLSTDQAGTPLLLVLVEDITERKQAEQTLIQTERLAIMGRMAASLAHEVNNPLQSVLGCLGLAAEAMEDGEDAATYMDVAMEEVSRAARIVRQMRDLGRRDDGRRRFEDIVGLVENVVILTEKQARDQSIEITWFAEEAIPQVPMVRDRIQQVILNLVLNAIEAMPTGGELELQVARSDAPAGVRVSVTDTGVGIAPGDLEHIFEAFHSSKELGLGMGLYVSRNIIQQHGGRIDVESTLGEGSTFTFWLPA